jgi:hypothetical protein
LDYRGLFFLTLMDNPFILLNSIDHDVMRLLVHLHVGVVIPLLDCCVIVNHRVVDDWCCTVVIDDGGAVNVGHTDISVIVHRVEIALVDHDGTVYVSVIADIDVDLGDVDVIDDHCMRPPPGTVAVVGLEWCQRHPSHIRSSVNPRNPSRIPVEAHIEQGHTDADANHRRGPVPVIPHVDPVAVMMGDIAEGFCRNPCLVSVPIGPAAHSEW